MPRKSPSKPDKHSGKQKLVLLALGVVAASTVFVLPYLVPEPQLDDEADAPPALPSSSGPESVSPSTAAEKTKYRQEAQDLLAEIITSRDQLQDQNVTVWGDAAFQQALKLIEAGDADYSYGEYRDSLDSYRQARDLLTGLEETGRELLAGALADGVVAVESLNVAAARTASDLAVAIAPGQADVKALAARVEALPQVTELVLSGDEARGRGRLQPARDAYQEAVALDPGHQRAAQSLADVRKDITEAEFRRHMSRGLEAMDRQDYAAARAAFGQANQVYPGHQSVRQALAQLNNQSSMDQVNRQLESAYELEAGEQWAEAVSAYQNLLKEDPSMAEARVRLLTAEVRADLDQRLETAMEDPLKLSGRQRFESAQATLQDARGIANPGPRLRGQIDALAGMLANARSVVQVEFHSDNETFVTVFRVAELGRFQSTALQLLPGRYIAAGTRAGYRDVQVEFVVTGQPMESPVIVRCEEPI